MGILSWLYGKRVPKTYVDPVCERALVPEHAVGPVTHDRRKFYFHDAKCMAKFQQNPIKYSLNKE